ncbi:hypothetical protein K2X30_04845 [bacterium]|nr:hypothetical protein [bacterium]
MLYWVWFSLALITASSAQAASLKDILAASNAKWKTPTPAPTAAPAPAPSPSAAVDPNAPSLRKETQAMSKTLAFQYGAAASSTDVGVDTSMKGTVMGKEKSLVQVEAEAPTETTPGVSEIYIGGLQLVSAQIPLRDLAYKKEFKLPTMDIQAVLLTYPVGPLVLQLDAGFSLSGGLVVSVLPIAAIPVEESSVQVEIVGEVQSMAYIEGSVTLLFLKGGVGGEVTVADGSLNLVTQVYLNGKRPYYHLSGHLEMFSGEIYASAKIFGLFGFKWREFWHHTFYKWNGLCYNLTNNLQSSGRCAYL